jgi:hypothetical protein
MVSTIIRCRWKLNLLWLTHHPQLLVIRYGRSTDMAEGLNVVINGTMSNFA